MPRTAEWKIWNAFTSTNVKQKTIMELHDAQWFDNIYGYEHHWTHTTFDGIIRIIWDCRGLLRVRHVLSKGCMTVQISKPERSAAKTATCDFICKKTQHFCWVVLPVISNSILHLARSSYVPRHAENICLAHTACYSRWWHDRQQKADTACASQSHLSQANIWPLQFQKSTHHYHYHYQEIWKSFSE